MIIPVAGLKVIPVNVSGDIDKTLAPVPLVCVAVSVTDENTAEL